MGRECVEHDMLGATCPEPLHAHARRAFGESGLLSPPQPYMECGHERSERTALAAAARRDRRTTQRLTKEIAPRGFAIERVRL